MRTKDILIIRMSCIFDITEEDMGGLDAKFAEKFKKIYNVLVIYGENETNKTTFEIIKY